jgi:hypothetical protein
MHLEQKAVVVGSGREIHVDTWDCQSASVYVETEWKLGLRELYRRLEGNIVRRDRQTDRLEN